MTFKEAFVEASKQLGKPDYDMKDLYGIIDRDHSEILEVIDNELEFSGSATSRKLIAAIKDQLLLHWEKN